MPADSKPRGKAQSFAYLIVVPEFFESYRGEAGWRNRLLLAASRLATAVSAERCRPMVDIERVSPAPRGGPCEIETKLFARRKPSETSVEKCSENNALPHSYLLLASLVGD
jgi:hypothetical protein